MRLIDADALPRHKQLEAMGNGQYEDVEIVYSSDIDNAPTIDPFKDKSLEQLMDECFNRGYQKAVRHGKWIRDGIDKWRCSLCGAGNNYAYEWSVRGEKMQDNYCPNCGARMDMDGDGE